MPSGSISSRRTRSSSTVGVSISRQSSAKITLNPVSETIVSRVTPGMVSTMTSWPSASS
jgi:hypothetical protein